MSFEGGNGQPGPCSSQIASATQKQFNKIIEILVIVKPGAESKFEGKRQGADGF